VEPGQEACLVNIPGCGTRSRALHCSTPSLSSKFHILADVSFSKFPVSVITATIIIDAIVEIVAAEDQATPMAIFEYFSNSPLSNLTWEAIRLAACDIIWVLEVKDVSSHYFKAWSRLMVM